MLIIPLTGKISWRNPPFVTIAELDRESGRQLLGKARAMDPDNIDVLAPKFDKRRYSCPIGATFSGRSLEKSVVPVTGFSAS